MKQVAITTKDNPFNPTTEFDQWYAFDMDKGYSTCCYLARIARTSDQFTDYENTLEIESAIDEIIKINQEIGNDIYEKVVITQDN